MGVAQIAESAIPIAFGEQLGAEVVEQSAQELTDGQAVGGEVP